MEEKLLVLLIADGMFLLIGVIMSTIQNKFKIPEKHTDIVWELVKYLTSAIAGYQIGAGIIK